MKLYMYCLWFVIERYNEWCTEWYDVCIYMICLWFCIWIDYVNMLCDYVSLYLFMGSATDCFVGIYDTKQLNEYVFEYVVNK